LTPAFALMPKQAKKSLGQNFLTDTHIQRKIISASSLTKQDTVIEIGSGHGEITRYLANSAGAVYAVEVDGDLCEELAVTFENCPNVRVLRQDILKLDIPSLLREGERPVTVIGNIPYYITTPIIQRLFLYAPFIKKVCLTVQKELAARMLAKPGTKEYGSLSIFVRYHTEPETFFIIKRSCFSPAPKVDSAFLILHMRRMPLLASEKEKYFFRVVRAAFSQRRKTLKNSVKGIIPQDTVESFCRRYGFALTVRAEELSLEDFINLINL